MIRPSTTTLLLSSILASACASTSKAPPVDVVSMRSDGDTVTVLADGATFARIAVAANERVAVTELHAPGGGHVLRGFPLAPRSEESADHPEHTGLWAGHGSVDGEDLWLGPGAARAIGHSVRLEGPSVAAIDVRLEWRARDGRLLCSELRRYRLRAEGAARFVDVEHDLTATSRGLVFRDVADGFFALRLADDFAVGPENPDASAVCSTGARDDRIRGQRARWSAHGASVAGADGERRAVAVYVLDHARNPQHPPAWGSESNGLVTANPFGRRAYDSDREDTATFEIDGFETIALRYRVVLTNEAPDFDEAERLWLLWTGDRWNQPVARGGDGVSP